ncbi:MAG: hypothetical protein AAF250_15385 [Pseudomonadota bacterium]
MQSEFWLSILVDPVIGVLVASAAVAAIFSAHFLRLSGPQKAAQADADALTGLFQRDTLEAKIRETAQLRPEPSLVRRARRAVRDQRAFAYHNRWVANDRQQTLEHVAAVLRRGERSGEAWDEVVKLIEGEGFVIVQPERQASISDAPDIPEGEIEEIMLLPAPAPTPGRASKAA